MTVMHEAKRVDDVAFRRLMNRHDFWERMIGAGARLPIRPLIEVDLGPIHLDRMMGTGPVVLVFVRHAGSAACNAAMVDFRTNLAPALSDLDAHLVAVSPQAPQRLAALKRRHDLQFFVAADPRCALIDALNIGFASPGADAILGTNRSVLPLASVVVADRAGTVRFVDVRASWATPPEAGRIVSAVASLDKPHRKEPRGYAAPVLDLGREKLRRDREAAA
ncbi:redoxin domain-containing protein [Actinoplanes sp. NPDC051475]|uniref:redoxin domain-containing protein n=1 Tax=Actinoplanes sp. NPDC051475 TaxID=3157225 RepID=UPI00344CA82E